MMATLKAASEGWSKIFQNKPGWETDFRLDAEGMNAGFTAYGAAVLIAIVLTSLRIGFPPPDVMLVLMIGHLIPLLTLVVVTAIVRRFVGFTGSTAGFIVPGLYLIALMKIVEGLTMMIGFPLTGAIAAVTAIMGYRLAKANGLAMPHAVGYGLAIFLLLAGLPAALYMLSSAL